MSPKLKNFLFAFLLALVLLTSAVFAQRTKDQRIINTIPKKVPLKVEILNDGMDVAIHEIEIKITNTGKKPIYFLDLDLNAEKNNKSEVGIGLPTLNFGNSRYGDLAKTVDSLPSELARTSSLSSEEFIVFKVSKRDADAFWKLADLRGYSSKTKIVLELKILSYGDGTGFVTSAAVEVPQKKSEIPGLTGSSPTGFFLFR